MKHPKTIYYIFVIIGTHEYIFTSLETPENEFNILETREYSFIVIETHEYKFLTLEIHEYKFITLETHEYKFITLETPENTWRARASAGGDPLRCDRELEELLQWGGSGVDLLGQNNAGSLYRLRRKVRGARQSCIVSKSVTLTLYTILA